MLLQTDEWQTASSFLAMWPIIRRQATKRQERLLAVAFCRRIAHLVTEERCKRLRKAARSLGAFGPGKDSGKSTCLLDAITLAERGEDGTNPEGDKQLRDLAQVLRQVGQSYAIWRDDVKDSLKYQLIATSEAAAAVHEAVYWTCDLRQVAKYAAQAVNVEEGGTKPGVVDSVEEATQCDLIRDVVQHPELAAIIAPKWKTEMVVSLARGIYDQRAFDRMPILADALEEAGCDDPAILRHCRADAPHVRGCWVVDQVLGYE